MKCILMNKNVPVIQVDMDPKTSYIETIEAVYNKEYLPVGVLLKDTDTLSQANLYKWWIGRSIPASRDGLQDVLKKLGLSDVQELVNKSFGISLSDQYWMKPKEATVEWKDINFFENDFSKDVGNAFFQTSFSTKKLNLLSPDNTSDGWLRKKWIILNGERYLLKAGSKPFRQEPFNEVIATRILEQTQNTKYVPYELYIENGIACSKCKNFITPETEFVSAYNLCSTIEVGTRKPYQHMLHCAEQYEIPNVKRFLDDMLTLDYIMLNTDRHWGNFGFIRNVTTLKFEGAAPIFDTGTSLWNNELKIIPYQEPSKPFRSNHSKQIRLVDTFDRFNIKTIKQSAADIAENILRGNSYIDDARRNMIAMGLENRIKNLSKIIDRQMTR